jgi:hypothetical protein
MPRFCTALCQGQPCRIRAQPGQPFCGVHHPHPATTLRQCEYFKLSGQRCRANTLRGQDHCFVHRPRNRRAPEPCPHPPHAGRPKASAKRLIFMKMPESCRAVLEAPQLQ